MLLVAGSGSWVGSEFVVKITHPDLDSGPDTWIPRIRIQNADLDYLMMGHKSERTHFLAYTNIPILHIFYKGSNLFTSVINVNEQTVPEKLLSTSTFPGDIRAETDRDKKKK
jgi:hypothetical protein